MKTDRWLRKSLPPFSRKVQHLEPLTYQAENTTSNFRAARDDDLELPDAQGRMTALPPSLHMTSQFGWELMFMQRRVSSLAEFEASLDTILPPPTDQEVYQVAVDKISWSRSKSVVVEQVASTMLPSSCSCQQQHLMSRKV